MYGGCVAAVCLPTAQYVLSAFDPLFATRALFRAERPLAQPV
jgi:hypothetical protein